MRLNCSPMTGSLWRRQPFQPKTQEVRIWKLKGMSRRRIPKSSCALCGSMHGSRVLSHCFSILHNHQVLEDRAQDGSARFCAGSPIVSCRFVLPALACDLPEPCAHHLPAPTAYETIPETTDRCSRHVPDRFPWGEPSGCAAPPPDQRRTGAASKSATISPALLLFSRAHNTHRYSLS